MKIDIYCDGSCINNKGFGGEGGAASVLIAQINNNPYIKSISKYFPQETIISAADRDILNIYSKTKKPYQKGNQWYMQNTNNRMEVQSIIIGLEAIKTINADIDIYADSKWAINALQGTWKVSENMDLVTYAQNLIPKFDSVEFIWVKGHNNNKYNEIANTAAMKAAEEKQGEILVLAGK